jgi:hypothetical protein
MSGEPMERLLDGEGDAYVRSLLRSAKHDAPAPRSRERAVAALGAAAAVGGIAAPTKLGASWKWAALGTIGVCGAIFAVEAIFATDEGTVSPAEATTIAIGTDYLPGATLSHIRAESLVEPQSTNANATPSTTAISTSASTSPPLSTSIPTPTPTGDDSLSREIAALDTARAALRSHNPMAALSALDAYARAFPRGALGPEATVLRIEALVDAGDRASANTLADQFFAAHPSSPHAARVRSLTKR